MNKILSFALLSITSCGFAQTRSLSTVDTVQKINQLEQVVVTAQYSPQSLKNSVYKVRTINSAKIRLSGATSLQQVLNTEVGFRFNTDLLLGVSDFEMMGMSGRNIKILLDGVPMVDRSDTRESLNQIDINTIERVEIVEGPVSVVYGTDALAGVINIITKSSQQGKLKIDARFQDETAGKEYQTFSGKGSHNQHINASWERNGWSILAGGSHNEFGGWNQPASTLSIQEFSQVSWWRPKEQYLANAKLGYQNDKLHLWYRIDALNEDIDSRFGMNPNNFKGILQTYRTNRYTHQLQSTLKLSPKTSFSGVLGYTNLTRSTKTTERDFSTGVEMLTTAAGQQDVATFNSSIFRATSTFNLIESLAIQTGVEWNRDEASAARISGNPVINDFALFASSEMHWGKLSLRPGLRFIANSIFEAPPVIPSLNAKLAIAKDVDLRLGYAKGFRSPALRELYYNFVDASHTIYGNPNLKAEESDSFNGSVAWTAVQQPDLAWSMNASGFYNFFRNRIDFVQDPNDNTITTLFNVARFRTAGGGIEQHLDYRQLKAAIALLYVGRYNNLLVNDPALQVPTMMWAPELSLNLNYGFAKSGTNIGIFYKYTGARPSYQLINNSPRQVEIGHFNWADFMVNQKINRFVNLNAGIKNLFNITQVNSTSTASGGAHSTGGGSVATSYGRSYVLGLSFSWTKN